MSRKHVNKILVDRQTLAVGETVTEPLFIADSTGVSLQVVWEGAPESIMTLQTSNDKRVDRITADSVWFTESTTISGMDGDVSDGSIMCHLDNVNSSYVRLNFAVTTAGTVSVFATTKV